MAKQKAKRQFTTKARPKPEVTSKPKLVSRPKLASKPTPKRARLCSIPW